MSARPGLARGLWIARVFVIWLSVTLALASVAVHSGEVLRPFITPHFDGALIFAAGFLLSLLIGLSVDSPKWAGLLSVAMCLVAAAVYGGVIYAPVWLGYTQTTVAFQNSVSQQVLLVFFWSIIPAVAGALAGSFGGSGLRQSRTPVDAGAVHSWWDRAQPPSDSTHTG